ncbi:MAG TPA: hypothetical protein VGI29_00440, partial [Candidatus Binataceae bacterium]
MTATPDTRRLEIADKPAGRPRRIPILDRVLPTEPDSPQAWLIVLAAFLSMFTLFAVAYSFGAFVKPMTAE